MLSPRLIAAAFGAATLAGLAFAAPASAAPVAASTAQATQAESGLVQQAQYYGPRRYYGRPAYRPRCFVTNRRVWNGFRWVIRPVRVCR